MAGATCSSTERLRRRLAVALLAAAACLPVSATEADSGSPASWRLSPRCPPGFEQRAGGRCYVATLYDSYGSLLGKGLGGTRTALPPRREGFTARQIDLGRYLFFDPLLSPDGRIACASCHRPDRGFADGRGRSVGIRGTPTRRGAPTLWNSAFLDRLFLDGRARSLEEQAAGPLFAADEMGNTPRGLLTRLRGSPAYRRLFLEAFPGRGDIELAQLYTALAAFQSSLISLHSRYDRYVHGDRRALDGREIAGLNVFRSFVARCAECHTPPLFTNRQFAVIGAPEPAGLPFDGGAGDSLGEPRLRGAFRVPTLRNIALTAPYMHSGRFATLDDVAAFYNGGRGHALPGDSDLLLHWHIVSPGLSDRELSDLVAFLATLTDQRFLPPVPARLPSGLAPVVASGAVAATGDSTYHYRRDTVPGETR